MPPGCSCFSPLCHAASAPWLANCLLWLPSHSLSTAGHRFPKLTAGAMAWCTTIMLLSPNTHCICPMLAAGSSTRKVHRSQQQALTFLISSKYLLVTEQRTLCHYVFPGATRLVEEGFGGPLANTHHPLPLQGGTKPSARAGADPQSRVIPSSYCALGWMMLVLGYFG